MKLRLVPARTGWLWFREGLRTFWHRPVALTGLFFLYVGVVSIVGLIPVVGLLLSLAVVPAATLGMMAATREVVEGRFPMPSVLLSAWRAGRQRARSMALLGLLYTGALLGVLALSALLDGGMLARLFLLGGELSPEMLTSDDFQNAVRLTMVLYLPVSMLFWFAPALVHWHGIAPVQSLFYSAVACIRNFWAFSLYTLAWSALIFGATLLVLLVALGLGNTTFVTALTLPLAMVLAAMFFTSIWFTFRDSYIADAPETPTTPAA